MGWTPEQISQAISALAIAIGVLLSAGSLVLGIFNYKNSAKQTGSALNEDLSVIAEREAKSRRELQEEFDDYKVRTDAIITKMQAQIEELSRTEYEYEIRNRIIVVGKKPTISASEIVSISSRLVDPKHSK